MHGYLRIGCAGWTIPKQHAGAFPSSGSHLVRYAGRFDAVEVNSSYHRAHRRTTYERWAGEVPDGFSFAAKAPKEITHENRLIGCGPAIDAFLAQVAGLGRKLGPILFQLPPSLGFEPRSAASFFGLLRARFDGWVVCEPRHADWFTVPADDLLRDFRVSRVAADPAVVHVAAAPGGWEGLCYLRLHGSPRMYYSEYSQDRLALLAEQLACLARGHIPVWCIFDNTAAGAATANALALQRRAGRLS